MTDSRDTMRWVWRGIIVAALLIGWLFIAWQNHFHFSAPVVIICLGYLAVVATIGTLWRTGAAVVDTSDDGADSTLAKPAGALGELEREKRTLLKAIKEAEFDHQMGKLSQRDVDDMIRMYRARAIEVIKDIDRLTQGSAGTSREQILREVRARLELETRSAKKAGAGAQPAGKATNGHAPREGEPPAVRAAERPEEAEASSVAASAPAGRETGGDDEGLDADSTTVAEAPRDDSAKEATP